MAKEFTGATHNDLPHMMEVLTEQIFKLNEKVDQLNNFPSIKETTINTQELCKRLRITEQTAIAWRKNDKIPFLQIDSVIRYEWSKVIIALENYKKIKKG